MIIFMIIVLWHVIFFLLSIKLDKGFFEKKKEFNIKQLNLIIRFYENFLKIKKWKDKIPLYVDKNGFSKKKLISRDIGYLNEFIIETYRGQWNHFMCITIIPILFFIDSINSVFIWSVLIFFLNIPCIFIQKYNRARLKKLIFVITYSKTEKKVESLVNI